VGPFREQLIQIALRYVYSSEDSTLTQIATCVLYNLGCSTTTEQKAQLCHLGVIKEMVALITRKKQANEFDMTTETATGLLWNITDECPPNCKEFIDCGGMELFMSVYKSNQNANALGAIRNLLGLLGNVAEVPNLRRHFIRDDVIEALVKLLDSEDEGIEISYNTCGILSHIGTDGPEVWTVSVPQKDVFAAMEAAIGRWDIDSERSINYHSLEPLLRIIKCKSCWTAQLWAVWALANLTNVSSGKYCPMVEKEGGIPILQEIFDDERDEKRMKELAGRALAVCDIQLKENNKTGLW
jgi:Zyg-11 family protein